MGVLGNIFGRGVLVSVNPSNPGVSTEWEYAVPKGYVWLVIGVWYRFTTVSPTADLRTSQVAYIPNTSVSPSFIPFPPPLVQDPDRQMTYSWAINQPLIASTQIGDPNPDQKMYAALPADFYLDGDLGAIITSATTNLGGDDEYEDIVIHAIQFEKS